MTRIIVLLLTIGLIQSSSAQEKKALPPPPPPKVDITKFSPPVRDPFYIRNPNVERVTWSKGNRINVTLKSGVREEYHLDKEAQKEVFLERYGEPPAVPPPPPPKKVNVKVKQ